MRRSWAAAAEYASYPAYARQFEAMGVEPSPGAVVDAVCLRGDRDAARERLDAYRRAGADLPVVYPALAPGRAPRPRSPSSEPWLRDLLPSRGPAVDFIRKVGTVEKG